MLPSRLRHRVGAVSAATVPLAAAPVAVGESSVDPAVLAAVASAAAEGQRLRFAYLSSDGTRSRRVVEPGRLVTAGRRWYLVGYDTGHDDWRTFRVDRMTEPVATGQRFASRAPRDADPAEFAISKLYSMAPVYSAVVTLHLPVSRARDRVAGDLEALDSRRCRFTSRPDTLEWLASRLIMLGCEFDVHEPPELIDHLAAVAARVGRAADPGPGL